MGLPWWLVRRTRTPPVFLPGTGRERLHGGGGRSHLLRARVLGGAVIKFLLIPLKKKSPASTNGRRMRQRDAGRLVLISSQRPIQSQPSKKQLRVWVRHKSAGIHRLPLRHHCRCRHDRLRTEENPRKFPCTALSRLSKSVCPRPRHVRCFCSPSHRTCLSRWQER